MLSQERVISLLYEKTFPMTSQEMHSAEEITDMQNLQMQQHDLGQQVEGCAQEDYGVEEDDEEMYARMQHELLRQQVDQVDEVGELDETQADNTTEHTGAAVAM